MLLTPSDKPAKTTFPKRPPEGSPWRQCSATCPHAHAQCLSDCYRTSTFDTLRKNHNTSRQHCVILLLPKRTIERFKVWPYRLTSNTILFIPIPKKYIDVPYFHPVYWWNRAHYLFRKARWSVWPSTYCLLPSGINDISARSHWNGLNLK